MSKTVHRNEPITRISYHRGPCGSTGPIGAGAVSIGLGIALTCARRVRILYCVVRGKDGDRESSSGTHLARANAGGALARATRYVPADQGLAASWNLILKGIDVGWLDEDELLELRDHLSAHGDFGVEELLFAHVGDDLRVSFLDDQATCPQSTMMAALDAVLRQDRA
jgi:hypothetical protein